MPAAKKKTTNVVVTAPLVQARVGSRILHFYAGDVLPSDVPDEDVDNLKSLGYVSAQDAPAEPDED